MFSLNNSFLSLHLNLPMKIQTYICNKSKPQCTNEAFNTDILFVFLGAYLYTSYQFPYEFRFDLLISEHCLGIRFSFRHLLFVCFVKLQLYNKDFHNDLNLKKPRSTNTCWQNYAVNYFQLDF